jgi:hypothetical protein
VARFLFAADLRMKKLVLTAVVLSLISLSAYAGGEKLIGTWKSNKEATLEHLKANTKLTPEQLEKIGTVLGEMKVVVTAEKLTFTHRKWKFVTGYRVIYETPTSIMIEHQDEKRKLVKSTLDLDEKGYWSALGSDKIPGYKERFDKVQ